MPLAANELPPCMSLKCQVPFLVTACCWPFDALHQILHKKKVSGASVYDNYSLLIDVGCTFINLHFLSSFGYDMGYKIFLLHITFFSSQQELPSNVHYPQTYYLKLARLERVKIDGYTMMNYWESQYAMLWACQRQHHCGRGLSPWSFPSLGGLHPFLGGAPE